MWQVSITADSGSEEAVASLLEETFQIPAVVYFDALSGKQTVTVYPSRLRDSPHHARARLRRALREIFPEPPGMERAKITVKALPRQNWAESWKRHFQPMEIGRALLIKPSWSRRRPRPGQRVILLDPGLSFGTGHHATTAYCLEQLVACRCSRKLNPSSENKRKKEQSFLDIGTGSGILAIAAAKLGYATVDAFDFDPESIRVSRANARRNRVADGVHPRRQDLTRLPVSSRRRWDVICANLTADLLLSQAEKIIARLKPGGHLILAGILHKEFRQICDKFVTFRLTLADNKVEKDWQSGRFDSPFRS